MHNVEKVFMQSPEGDELREVEGTTAILTPLMVAGWHQVPAPAAPAVEPTETKEAK